MKSLYLAFVAACMLFGASLAVAAEVEVEGFKFPETAVVYGTTLVLNGAGTSGIFNQKGTAVGFYLPKKQTTVEGVYSEKGAKRILFYMLRDISSRDLANVMLDAIRQNAPDDFHANIPQTAQLGAVFGSRPKMFKGEMIAIDYDPSAQLSTFYSNGIKQGDSIKGESFFPMMMKIWIGPKVRPSQRDALLGLPK